MNPDVDNNPNAPTPLLANQRGHDRPGPNEAAAPPSAAAPNLPAEADAGDPNGAGRDPNLLRTMAAEATTASDGGGGDGDGFGPGGVWGRDGNVGGNGGSVSSGAFSAVGSLTDSVIDLLDSDADDGGAAGARTGEGASGGFVNSDNGEQEAQSASAAESHSAAVPVAGAGGAATAEAEVKAAAGGAPSGGAGAGGNDGDNESDDDVIEIVGTTASAPAASAARDRAADMPAWMVEAAASASASAPSSATAGAIAMAEPDGGNGTASEAGSGGQSQTSADGSGFSPAMIEALQQMFDQRHQHQHQQHQPEQQQAQQQMQQHQQHWPAAQGTTATAARFHGNKSPFECSPHTYVELPYDHVPTWSELLPHPKPAPRVQNAVGPRAYRLSLLSCKDFTITAIQHPHRWDSTGRSVNLAGLRIHIKKISKEHGGATYERGGEVADNEGGGGSPSASSEGRWRIPLGAYRAFHGFLCSDPQNYVEGIPDYQLRIATLGRERMDREYPTEDQLVEVGVPRGISRAMAPYQRGGVDFVLDRDGRALVADEMGLGKTIQAIAAMSAYEKEWPLIVFCPSTARYHWEGEFRHWLGAESVMNKEKADDDDNFMEAEEDRKISTASDEKKDDWDEASAMSSSSAQSPAQPAKSMRLLRNSEINVLTSSKDRIFPTPETRVVVCSYGLAPNLISGGIIKPGMFRCAIVDESHMLKNKNTKRTRTILPILFETDRCILLSGTPAFSRPLELWPQLSVLGHRRGWWTDEADYISKYGKKDDDGKDGEGGGSGALAELHALLTSTVMIRRMKAEMLKNLPKKIRSSAQVRIKDEALKKEIRKNMTVLRQGKGALGKLAREHKIGEEDAEEGKDDGGNDDSSRSGGDGGEGSAIGGSSNEGTISIEAARGAIHQETEEKYRTGMDQLVQVLRSDPSTAPENVDRKLQFFKQQMVNQLEEYRANKLSVLVVGGLFNGLRIVDGDAPAAVSASAADSSIAAAGGVGNFVRNSPESEQDEESSRKAILSQLYTLTGRSKVPLLVRMLKKWLDDPARGKLCIFAHHIEILDAITQGAGLDNSSGSKTKYIRIDGSTNPKVRQEQMTLFQTDPTVRIAILGITAAGVAVTLTAASTVWFAELFWTPAIMIQAEDRCHRIGQQASVRCLYMIGRGTLDEVLWKLIEKKFRDLGEFVEGKENLDIVMHRNYDCGMEALQSDAEAEDESDEGSTEEETGQPFKRQKTESFGDLADQDVIQHDIEELAKEEEALLKTINEDDDDAEVMTGNSGFASKVKTKESRDESSKIGKSETSAICLSDDEEDDSPTQTQQEKAKPKLISETIAAYIKSGARRIHFDGLSQMPRMRVYTVTFQGPMFGLVMSRFEGRIVLKQKHPQRAHQLGRDAKPDVGDILLAINNILLPHRAQFTQVTQLMKKAIHQGPAKLAFAEDPDFSTFYREVYLPQQQAAMPVAGKTNHSGSSAQAIEGGVNVEVSAPVEGLKSDVIELLDDD